VKRREFISVRLSERERAQLDKMAKLWGTPRSDIVRLGLGSSGRWEAQYC
jgi:hypothetical protein